MNHGGGSLADRLLGRSSPIPVDGLAGTRVRRSGRGIARAPPDLRDLPRKCEGSGADANADHEVAGQRERDTADGDDDDDDDDDESAPRVSWT
jgi:hypothetical protein